VTVLSGRMRRSGRRRLNPMNPTMDPDSTTDLDPTMDPMPTTDRDPTTDSTNPTTD